MIFKYSGSPYAKLQYENPPALNPHSHFEYPNKTSFESNNKQSVL